MFILCIYLGCITLSLTRFFSMHNSIQRALESFWASTHTYAFVFKRTPRKTEYQDSVDFMNGDWGFFLLKYKVNKNSLGTIHLRRRQIFKILDPYPYRNSIRVLKKVELFNRPMHIEKKCQYLFCQRDSLLSYCFFNLRVSI